ncbi:tetratricopeptide repeat protein [Tenacibaculum finnmarkense]|uniref:tetratricopeptide repeat protein n=1 Tax=Tenacibaculum finnmarkense TaxID=2781243 RepID=UPI001EFC11F5|nr:hypothetical protein [Tenacibaculum finnmarkense]MCG8796444.1 hypothetical protein [Tenacibaculum finnmarkense]MCG8798774.1 hypothetical protein [Tenacibaculum finnmarkense]
MDLDINQMSGVAAYNNGLYEESVQHFSKAISTNLNFFHWRSYKGRGTAFIKLEKFENALNDFNMLIKAYNQNRETLSHLGSEIYYTRGRINENLGNIKNAESDFRECLKLDTRNLDCNISLFNLVESRHDYKEALRILEKIIELSPNDDYSDMRRQLLEAIKN